MVPLLFQADLLFGVTQFQGKEPLRFIQDPSRIRASLQLPMTGKKELVRIPKRKMKLRIKKGSPDSPIEPLQIYIPKDEIQLRRLTLKLARSGDEKALLKSLMGKLRTAKPNDFDKVKVSINMDDFRLIRVRQLADILSKPHRKVSINSSALFANRPLRKAFFRQLKGFISRNNRYGIYAKLKQGVDLNMETDLLPRFAQKMIKKFLVYRGPNCFHAALAFHGTTFTRSPVYNIKEEKGYHKAMINYDELWRTINAAFYEVNPDHSSLKYGDMLVFFDVPRGRLPARVDFHWIRHTATYLFGNYTFSKGSKSPSTPYTLKTLDDEWKTWRAYTKNLGVKVFRRNSGKMRRSPPPDRSSWIY